MYTQCQLYTQTQLHTHNHSHTHTQSHTTCMVENASALGGCRSLHALTLCMRSNVAGVRVDTRNSGMGERQGLALPWLAMLLDSCMSRGGARSSTAMRMPWVMGLDSDGGVLMVRNYSSSQNKQSNKISTYQLQLPNWSQSFHCPRSPRQRCHLWWKTSWPWLAMLLLFYSHGDRCVPTWLLCENGMAKEKAIPYNQSIKHVVAPPPQTCRESSYTYVHIKHTTSDQSVRHVLLGFKAKSSTMGFADAIDKYVLWNAHSICRVCLLAT